MSDDINRMLGRIDGKLDQVIETFKEHRDDDVRRFGDVYSKLDSHAKDINQAKGAKRATLALAGAAATVISLAVAAAGKFL